MKVYHYVDPSGLESCFVVTCQSYEANGCWTGRVISRRFASHSTSETVAAVKHFGLFDDEAELLEAIDDWIRLTLFERWTTADLCETEEAEFA